MKNILHVLFTNQYFLISIPFLFIAASVCMIIYIDYLQRHQSDDQHDSDN